MINSILFTKIHCSIVQLSSKIYNNKIYSILGIITKIKYIQHIIVIFRLITNKV